MKSLLFLNLGLLVAALIGLIFSLRVFWLSVLAVPILFVTFLLLVVAAIWRSASRSAKPS